MWPQFIKFRMNPGTGARVKYMIDHLIATAPPDINLLQELAVSDQRDPMSVVSAR